MTLASTGLKIQQSWSYNDIFYLLLFNIGYCCDSAGEYLELVTMGIFGLVWKL
jgi:hypothetical protein